MGLLAELFGPSQADVWSKLAAQLGGTFTEGGWLSSSMVQARTGDWIVTLDTVAESKTTFTRLRAPFINRDRFHFTINRSGLFTDLGKLLGMQDIEVGDPLFDREFVVQGDNVDRVRQLLSNPRIRQLLQAQPQVYVTVRDDEGWFAASFPDGVDELHFQVHGVVKDLGVLKGMYDLFAETLHHLTHMDSGYRDDEMLHLEALAGPGGVIEHGGTVLWEGESARVRAVQGLGKMGSRRAVPALCAVLDSAAQPLRCAAIDALAEIADPAAVPSIIPCLGEGEPVLRHAAKALTVLGQGSDANLFLGIVAQGVGDPRALTAHRREYTQAFCRVMRGRRPLEISYAAHALHQLGAVETLPDLRAAARTLGNGREVPPSIRERVDAAIRELEKHQALPRPADMPHQEAENLPLPAAGEELDASELPRASSRPVP
jgi:hypothetical protein